MYVTIIYFNDFCLFVINNDVLYGVFSSNAISVTVACC